MVTIVEVVSFDTSPLTPRPLSPMEEGPGGEGFVTIFCKPQQLLLFFYLISGEPI